jgi:hypothetical protein
MMKENSPMGVTIRPARNASCGRLPIKVRPVVTALTRTRSVKPVSARMSHQDSPSKRTSICKPMPTKNTALKISRIPSNTRST